MNCRRFLLTFIAALIVIQQALSQQASFRQASTPSGNESNAPAQVQINYLAYSDFFHFLGQESGRLLHTEKDGNVQAVAKTDYAVDIGISVDEERALRAIALEEYGKEQDLNCDATDRRVVLEATYGHEQARQIIADAYKICLKQRPRMLRDAVGRLRRELEEGSFEKVNSYIAHNGWVKDRSVPCRGNTNPGPDETNHRGCTSEYLNFFWRIADTEKRNQLLADQGRESEQNRVDTVILLPKDKEEAVITLSLEAAQDMGESYRRFMEACDQYDREHKLQSPPYPYPPELEALAKGPGMVAEKYIPRLKEELGEQYFRQIDEMFAARGGLSRAESSVNPRANSPASEGTPKVQP
jgi:hypothetical protein